MDQPNILTECNVESNSEPTIIPPKPTGSFNVAICKWSTYSKLEKLLSVFLLVASALCVTVIVIISLLYAKVLFRSYLLTESSTSGYAIDLHGHLIPICEREDCTIAASDIIQGLDKSYEPCDDFVQFSCGGWKKHNPVPHDSSRWDQFNVLIRRLNIIMSSILEKNVNASDSNPLLQVKNLYEGCLDEAQLELKGLEPIAKLLEKFGGWPMTTSVWDHGESNWGHVAALSRSLMPIDHIFRLSVRADMKNTSKNAIYIDQPYFALPRSMLLEPESNEKRISAYRKYITSTAKLLFKEFDDTKDFGILKREVDNLYNFESSLANISTAYEDRRDINDLYRKMTIRELTGRSYNTDWLAILKTIFTSVDVEITDRTEVIVMEIEYIINMTRLINETDKRVVVNYILWRIIKYFAKETTKDMRKIGFEYSKVAYGIKTMKPRNIVCSSQAVQYMGMAIGTKYTETLFTKATKNNAHEMIENIKIAFQEMLSNTQWMDKRTKPLADYKLNAISEIIGYPDWYETDDGLTNYYKNLEVIDKRNHFNNVLRLSYFHNLERLTSIREPVDKNKWFTTPVIVNAFYKSTFNAIAFPAAILQPPFYRSSGPQYLNYGGIGQVIGHEITHGFDDIGRQFTYEGNIGQWWTNETVEKFKKKAQCMIDQYQGYKIPELDTDTKNVTVNGKLTIGENIADNGGVRAAYFAYQKFVEEHGSEPGLPGLTQYSSEQLFFISNAQIWCSSSTEEGLSEQVITDSHSPGNFRVIGSLSNMKEFSQVWNCPIGSKMNPEDKCKVW